MVIGGSLSQAVFHVGALVGGVVVADQVHRKRLGTLRSMVRRNFRNRYGGAGHRHNFAGQHVQRREQRGGAVAL